MQTKPTMMNEEWSRHVNKLETLLFRVNRLEKRIADLEAGYDTDKEEEDNEQEEEAQGEGHDGA